MVVLYLTGSASVHHLDPPVGEVVHRADDADLLLLYGLAEDRRGGLQLLDVENDVLPDGVLERVTGLVEHGLDRGTDARHQCREMAGERGVVLDRFDRCANRTARLMSENHDERCAEGLRCVFEAGDPVVRSEVARYAYDE